VTGGAGAVGQYAIQLARWFVATASTPQKQPAGAEHVVDYRDRGVADRVLDAVGPIDRVIDGAFGANLSLTGAVPAVKARSPPTDRTRSPIRSSRSIR
jgi:NADPH2:quinone reductase